MIDKKVEHAYRKSIKVLNSLSAPPCDYWKWPSYQQRQFTIQMCANAIKNALAKEILLSSNPEMIETLSKPKIGNIV